MRDRGGLARGSRTTLTVDGFRELLPEAEDLDIERHELPNLRAVNFVVHGLLGQGVARPPGSTRRPRRSASGCAPAYVDIPEALL